MAIQTYNYLHRTDDDYTKLDTYTKKGGFEMVKKALQMGQEGVIEEVKKAVVRGRGGAGFPAGVKWGFVPKDTDKPKYLVVNGDESEPGTFKDVHILSKDPFRLIEGCIITSMALDIHTVYIFCRGEFHFPVDVMWDAIRQCEAAGILGDNVMGTGYKLNIYMHKGAGAYICGEETGLLEALEGKPGQPRMKPPFPAVVGAFGCPTVINNVETIAAVPFIIDHGWEWWLNLGIPGDGGTRIMGLSGHIKKPGIYEVSTGISLDEFIYECGGGILDDREILGVIPGGVSCPVLTAEEIKGLPMSVVDVQKAGSMLGTCGVIVMHDGTDMAQALSRISHFYKHESCGQCTPCREGTGWMSRIIDRIVAGHASEDELDKLLDVANNIGGHTICALGDAAQMPVVSFITKFPEHFRRHLKKNGSVAA